MKQLVGEWFDKHRLRGDAVKLWGWDGDATCGAFQMPSPYTGRILTIIASSGEGWDHISISTPKKCPTWLEMEAVAKIFFKDDEVAYQLHVPSPDHINIHDYTLHWWRPTHDKIPLPPKVFV